MKLKTQSVPANGTLTARVEKPILGFLLKLKPTAAARSLTELRTLLDDSKATVNVTDAYGSSTRLYNDTPVGALASYVTAGEGSLYTSSTEYMVLLPVGEGGALGLGNNESIDLELQLRLASDVEVYGIEAPQRTPVVAVWSAIDVPTGGSQKQYDVERHTSCVFNPESFKDIQFRHSNGVTTQLTADEFLGVAQLANDQTVGGHFQIGANVGYITYPLSTVVEITVTSVANNAIIHLVEMKSVTSEEQALAANEALETVAVVS